MTSETLYRAAENYLDSGFALEEIVSGDPKGDRYYRAKLGEVANSVHPSIAKNHYEGKQRGDVLAEFGPVREDLEKSLYNEAKGNIEGILDDVKTDEGVSEVLAYTKPTGDDERGKKHKQYVKAREELEKKDKETGEPVVDRRTGEPVLDLKKYIEGFAEGSEMRKYLEGLAKDDKTKPVVEEYARKYIAGLEQEFGSTFYKEVETEDGKTKVVFDQEAAKQYITSSIRAYQDGEKNKDLVLQVAVAPETEKRRAESRKKAKEAAEAKAKAEKEGKSDNVVSLDAERAKRKGKKEEKKAA